MKYHKKNNLIAVLTTILLLLTFTLDSYSASRYILVHPNGKKNAIHFRSFSGKKYISLLHIRDLLFRKHKISLKYNEITHKHERFRATAGSFYLLYEKNGKVKIAQMTSPAITVKNMLYLPMISFFRSLPTLDLYYVSIEGNNIILKNEKHRGTSKDITAGRTYEGTFHDDIPVTGDDPFESTDDHNFGQDDFDTFDDITTSDDFEEISTSERDDFEEGDFEANDIDTGSLTKKETDPDFEVIESDDAGFDEFDEEENFDIEPFEDESYLDAAEIGGEREFRVRSLPGTKEKETSFAQPALKFSFLYSANYIKEGFDNISTTHSKAIRRNNKDRKIQIEPEKEEKTTGTKAKKIEKKEPANKRKTIFPPNVYVLPKNLIRRELNK